MGHMAKGQRPEQMSDPANMDEFNTRFYASLRYTGSGVNLTCHTPCPFCAAPDFAAWPVLALEHAMTKEAVCTECGRGSRANVVRTSDSTTFTIVQTRGDDPPPHIPKVRREEP